MRKKFVWITYCLLIALMGCGGESSNPTVRIDSLVAIPATVAPGGSAIITAQVVKAGEEPTPAAGTTTTTTTMTTTVQSNAAWGVNVTFRLLTANGGRLSALTQKTDGNGVAMIVYTAGNNYSQDVIQATLENENSASLIIEKTGSVLGPVISLMEAKPSDVIPGQQSIVTITVTDNTKPVAGEYVDVRISPNNSGASLLIQNPYTDAQGQVVAVYSAGSIAPVTDVVQARVVSSGSVNSVIISVNSPTATTSGTTTIGQATVATDDAKMQTIIVPNTLVCTTVLP